MVLGLLGMYMKTAIFNPLLVTNNINGQHVQETEENVTSLTQNVLMAED